MTDIDKLRLDELQDWSNEDLNQCLGVLMVEMAFRWKAMAYVVNGFHKQVVDFCSPVENDPASATWKLLEDVNNLMKEADGLLNQIDTVGKWGACDIPKNKRAYCDAEEKRLLGNLVNADGLPDKVAIREQVKTDQDLLSSAFDTINAELSRKSAI